MPRQEESCCNLVYSSTVFLATSRKHNGIIESASRRVEEKSKKKKTETNGVGGSGWNRACSFNDPPALVDSLDPIIRRVELSFVLPLCFFLSSRGRRERALFSARDRHSLPRLFFLWLPIFLFFFLSSFSSRLRMLLTSLVFRLAATAIYTRPFTN